MTQEEWGLQQQPEPSLGDLFGAAELLQAGRSMVASPSEYQRWERGEQFNRQMQQAMQRDEQARRQQMQQQQQMRMQQMQMQQQMRMREQMREMGRMQSYQSPLGALGRAMGSGHMFGTGMSGMGMEVGSLGMIQPMMDPNFSTLPTRADEEYDFMQQMQEKYRR